MSNNNPKPRNLVLVLGDQLDPRSSAFDGFDPHLDIVWMAEVAEESTHVWSHKSRIALFLSAMRHFRDDLIGQGFKVLYRELDDPRNKASLAAELKVSIADLRPRGLIVVEPGEWRIANALEQVAQATQTPLDVRIDRHFLCTKEDFAQHARQRKQMRLEFFYREMRQKTSVLMDGDQPIGGAWNFDKENRENFGKTGPGIVPKPIGFHPDATTRSVLTLVEKVFAKHPGRLDLFDWPVTPSEARRALEDFIAQRLPLFGQYEDAMWSGDSVLYHSRLSCAMNLKLLDPRDVIQAAELAYRETRAPLFAVEGFIRQILGWREYVRGIYWLHMPKYLELNVMNATLPLPSFYWTGRTEMKCLREVIGQTLDLGYAHHIQRLMVTGLFALLLGVRPQEVHKWYLAVYVDAVEWVELPNTLGMSQFGDGGIMASKPYVATGKYIQRMSNYCRGCAYNPAEKLGLTACPFTTLYWDYLLRHEKLLEKNQRMTMQLKNLARIDEAERNDIRAAADLIKKSTLLQP